MPPRARRWWSTRPHSFRPSPRGTAARSAYRPPGRPPGGPPSVAAVTSSTTSIVGPPARPARAVTSVSSSRTWTRQPRAAGPHRHRAARDGGIGTRPGTRAASARRRSTRQRRSAHRDSRAVRRRAQGLGQVEVAVRRRCRRPRACRGSAAAPSGSSRCAAGRCRAIFASRALPFTVSTKIAIVRSQPLPPSSSPPPSVVGLVRDYTAPAQQLLAREVLVAQRRPVRDHAEPVQAVVLRRAASRRTLRPRRRSMQRIVSGPGGAVTSTWTLTRSWHPTGDLTSRRQSPAIVISAPGVDRRLLQRRTEAGRWTGCAPRPPSADRSRRPAS